MATPRYWKDLSPEEKKRLAEEANDVQSELTVDDLRAIDGLDYSNRATVVQMLVNGTGHITTRP